MIALARSYQIQSTCMLALRKLWRHLQRSYPSFCPIRDERVDTCDCIEKRRHPRKGPVP